MANRQLTPDELQHANALLAEVRQKLESLSHGDTELLFAYRRKIFKELTYDERSKPMARRKLKDQKWKEQRGLCAICGKELPEKYTVLDRFKAVVWIHQREHSPHPPGVRRENPGVQGICLTHRSSRRRSYRFAPRPPRLISIVRQQGISINADRSLAIRQEKLMGSLRLTGVARPVCMVAKGGGKHCSLNPVTTYWGCVRRSRSAP